MPKNHREAAPAFKRFPPWKFAVLGAASLALIGALLFAKSEFILVRPMHNGVFRVTEEPLLEDPPEHPRLQLLRRREHLDQVLAPGRSQFEKILLLRRWARSQWPPDQQSFYYPAWDAVEILDLARRHNNHGFCAQYSIVFLQALAAMGIPARYVNLGHFVVGVWSDDYDRWVLMDPTNDIHFERRHEPMRGLELCEAAWGGSHDSIYKVGSDGRRSLATREDLSPYRVFSFLKKNDQLTDPPLIKVNGQLRRLTLAGDYRAYPRVGRDAIDYGNEFIGWQGSPEQRPYPGERFSDDIDDFKDSYNQCIILTIRKVPEHALVKVKFIRDQTPEFQEYLISINGTPGVTDRNEGVVHLEPGRNVFKARVKTKFGWLGPESATEYYFKPDWLRRSR